MKAKLSRIKTGKTETQRAYDIVARLTQEQIDAVLTVNRDVARDEAEKEIVKRGTDYDILFSYILNTVFGFGAKRLKQFYKELLEKFFTDKKTYGCVDYAGMKRHLEESGIFVEQYEEDSYKEIYGGQAK